MNKTFQVTLSITHEGNSDEHELAQKAAQRAYVIQGVSNCTIVSVTPSWPFVPAARLAAQAVYRREHLDSLAQNTSLFGTD